MYELEFVNSLCSPKYFIFSKKANPKMGVFSPKTKLTPEVIILNIGGSAFDCRHIWLYRNCLSKPKPLSFIIIFGKII
jgi:hypothetical protein